MRFLVLLIGLLILFQGCKKKETPKIPPGVVTLLYPEKGLECTTGTPISATTSQVEFRWQAAENTESYDLIVTNLRTTNKQEIITSNTSAKLPLEKGTAFSWVVLSKNSQVMAATSSQTWQFFNTGFETSHTPFPALVITPEMGDSVHKDINNEVTLEWSLSDVDNDIVSVSLYFDTEKTPVTLIETFQSKIESTKVSVTADEVYYWKIITTDSEGNTSDSGVFEFRVY